jgi:hypothetical protein
VSTALLRITLAPFVAAALLAFAAALLIEWLGDLARTCPNMEKPR